MCFTDEDIIRLSASAEKGSEHSLGDAIVRASIMKDLQLTDPQDFIAIPGKGIFAKVNDKEIILGNEA